MNKKFELIPQEGTHLFRIRALRDFSDVKAGDLGGYVEKEDNLSHEDECWIYDNVQVYDNAQVHNNARVYGNALVYDNVQVYNNAQVYDNALVYGGARVYGDARVFQKQHIRFGHYNKNTLVDLLRCSLGVHPTEDGYIYVYKRVNKDYTSEHVNTFVYPKEGLVEAKEYNPDPAVSCGAGLHFSTNEYWPIEDETKHRMLLAEVHLDDIITCQEGKIRVKKAYIINRSQRSKS